jgi:hypothetical protein
VRPFDPELGLLAEAGGEPAGAAISERGVGSDPDTGRVHVLARAAAVARARPRLGAPALAVDAENPTNAVALYERAGMSARGALRDVGQAAPGATGRPGGEV